MRKIVPEFFKNIGKYVIQHWNATVFHDVLHFFRVFINSYPFHNLRRTVNAYGLKNYQ